MDLDEYMREQVSKAKEHITLLMQGLAPYSILDEYTYMPKGFQCKPDCRHEWVIDIFAEDGLDWVNAHCKRCGLPLFRAFPFCTERYIYMKDDGSIDRIKTKEWNDAPIISNLEKRISNL